MSTNWIPGLSGRAHPDVERAIRIAYENIYELRGMLDSGKDSQGQTISNAQLLGRLEIAIALIETLITTYEAYRPRVASGSVDLTSATNQTITSISTLGAGRLTAFACRIGTVAAGPPFPTATIDINSDVKGIISIPLYSASNVWSGTVNPFTTANTAGSIGGTVGDTFIIPFAHRFASTLSVAVNVTVAGTAGALACSVAYGTQR